MYVWIHKMKTRFSPFDGNTKTIFEVEWKFLNTFELSFAIKTMWKWKFVQFGIESKSTFQCQVGSSFRNISSSAFIEKRLVNFKIASKSIPGKCCTYLKNTTRISSYSQPHDLLKWMLNIARDVFTSDIFLSVTYNNNKKLETRDCDSRVERWRRFDGMSFRRMEDFRVSNSYLKKIQISKESQVRTNARCH